MNKLEKVGYNLIRSPFAKGVYPYRVDILIVLGLSVAIAIATAIATHQIPEPIFSDFYAQDVWFGSDIPTVFGNITSFDSDFGRNNKHPLFPLLVFPLVYGPAQLLNLEPIVAVRLLIVATAVVWVSALYALFRLMGCHRLDASLLSILAGVSAASLFWLTVPESFPLGSVTIILGLIFVVLTQYRKFPFIWYVGINVLTVSITITNAMVGIFATFVNQSWKRILQIGIVSLLLSTFLWMAQRIVFKNSGFPFQPGTFIGEKKFITAPEHNSVLDALSAFFYQTIVMPAAQFIPFPLRPDWIKVDINPLAPASAGPLGFVSVIAWTALLLLGVWGFFSTRRHGKLRLVLGLTLLAQMAMHSVYGANETFIYTLHFVPLLLTLVAFSLLTRLRPLSLILIAVLIISAGTTNWAQFGLITSTLRDYGTPQQQLEAQMKLRPSDPWPRHEGHVILAATASSEESKAFHEPGGSFSPQPGSFGVSIWMIDSQGNLKTTSDTIPLTDIQQNFIENSGTQIPGIATRTPYYQSSWRASRAGAWQFNLTSQQANTKPVVMIRSVGPAGGNVNTLNWNGQRLLINDRWVIKNLPPQVKVYLGSERSPNWTHEKTIATEWQDEQGWGYARLELDTPTSWQLEIEDLVPPVGVEGVIADAATEPLLNLPDAQFVDSFKAQIHHLTMGLVGNQTRPGDPLSYPLPRFREGAYQVVALARAGHLELAKQLVPYFAATDFTNGMQPAADVPALGIWVLATVADQANQSTYDQLVWPDIARKAEIVVDLISSNRPGYPVASAAEKPFSEHPDLIQAKLTAGKMDATPGLIALAPEANFMGYRALLDAAQLAERMNQPRVAERWRFYATQLQAVWKEDFERRSAELETIFTMGLWPSGLASVVQDQFKNGLETRWQTLQENPALSTILSEDPVVNLAEAHQWLYLNQPERAWSSVRHLWQHQTSPGLFTWKGELRDVTPDSLSQWQRVRGWHDPLHLTPYKWAAAEMALLQLDMLAYVDTQTNPPTLVVGAGILKDWLNQPIRVKNLFVGNRLISWEWDGKQMTVQIRGKEMPVRLGISFSKNDSINVDSIQDE